MTQFIWKTKKWDAVTRDELYSFSRLRINVFVVEQDCPYPEFDGKDQEAIHLWTEEASGKTLAYLRILPPGTHYSEAAIGRVVVDSEWRKSGVGRALMLEGIMATEMYFGKIAIRISAQQYLIKFYESLEFRTQGDGYLEDGIPHIEMLYQP